jgi:hypothetical protein
LKFILTSYDFPSELEEKIFEIKTDSNNSILKIVSYFPLDELEKNNLILIINQPDFVNFNSIFTDIISNNEWNRTKSQIKKRFQDEIFHIDEK